MSHRTVLNESYKGLVENMSIPAEVHERDGKRFASVAGVVPIHCCTEEQVATLSATTHHYCDVFTDSLLAPLEELAFVRLDDSTAEKVFINRSKRILITSADGRLAQWRSAPTFESTNQYVAGAPIVNKEGALISVVTARRGNHYAVSCFEGDGGYFETSLPWRTLDVPAGQIVYGASLFPSRAALTSHLAALPPPASPGEAPPAPVLARATPPRVALVAGSGRQIAHHYLHGVLADGVDYL